MEAKLWTNFHRITLVHKYKQRANDHWSMNMVVEDPHQHGRNKNLVILELKQEKKTLGVPLVKTGEQGFHPVLWVNMYTVWHNCIPENKLIFFCLHKNDNEN